MDMFVEKVKAVINKYHMLQEGDSIVVGVSGGPDSLCLLHVLRSLSEEYGLRLFAVHLNHCFRGKEADEDAEYVARICEDWGITCVIETFDIPAYASETGLSAEEAGRMIRYRIFEETAKKVGAARIAVAQNMNDQVETVLMRLLRGSGPEGLKGIEPVRDNIIRPLIEIGRAEIEEYCAANKLSPRIDKTNLQPIYIRNKIRLELLPYLQKNFNPNIFSTILRLSDIAKEENQFLEEQTRIFFGQLAQQEEDRIRLETGGLKAVHPAIRRRIVRLGIEKLAGSLTGFEYKNFENVLELLEKATGAAVMLPKGLKAYISYDFLIISKIVEKQDKKCYYKLKYHDNNNIPGSDVSITVDTAEAGRLEGLPRDKYTIFIDGEKLREELVYRNRREGDRFSPIGMKGSKKLKDYFIDEKIPKEERDEIELLADGKEIIWVIGKRLSEKYKITGSTKNIIIIKYRRGSSNGEHGERRAEGNDK